MNENEIKSKVFKQWQGTSDNNDLKYALDVARICGHRETVNQDWRWLTDDLTELYDTEPDVAAATLSYIKGWIEGATQMLNKALMNFIER